MNSSFLRLDKTAGEGASESRAWLAFALEAAGASRWEIALPRDSFSLTELWQRMTGDGAATAIPRADLLRLREPLSALLEGRRAELTFEFRLAGGDGRPPERRCVMRLVPADPANGRPRRLRGLNFTRRAAPARDAETDAACEPFAEASGRPEVSCQAVAHELGTPARTIAECAQVLLEVHGKALPEGTRELVERIAAAGRRLDGTVGGLAELSQLASARLQRDRLDLAAMAREAWDELDPGNASHAARLDVDCEGAPSVLADRALARIVLRNLLGNARKFSRSKPRSAVTFAWCPGPSGHFFVRDRGIGFDGRLASGLFEPFGRLHAHEAFEGTGLGLATARRIVERHGGRLWAESRPGEGATFRFTLPAA